jgi:hypothetical protein
LRLTYHERDAELAQGDHTEVRVEEVWLSSSPDCKPFDFFVCGVSELRVKAKSHNKSKDLIKKMKEVMGSLARDTLAKACNTSGPGARLSSQLMVVLLSMLIVNMYLCQLFFTSIKSADFQLRCAI